MTLEPSPARVVSAGVLVLLALGEQFLAAAAGAAAYGAAWWLLREPVRAAVRPGSGRPSPPPTPGPSRG